MTDQTRATTVEERLRAIEDRLEIYNVVSAYGPAVDSLNVEGNAVLWAEDGVYQVDGLGDYEGHDGLKAMIDGDFHQNVVRNGSGHILSLPHVLIDRDKAVATNYGTLFSGEGGEFKLVRLIASRWYLSRRGASWVIDRRTNFLLDGRQAGRDLLARAAEGPSKETT